MLRVIIILIKIRLIECAIFRRNTASCIFTPYLNFPTRSGSFVIERARCFSLHFLYVDFRRFARATSTKKHVSLFPSSLISNRYFRKRGREEETNSTERDERDKPYDHHLFHSYVSAVPRFKRENETRVST